MTARRPLRHWLLLVSLVAMWGSSFPATKVAVAALPPLTVVALRLLIAAVTLSLLLAIVGRRLPREPRLWLWFAAFAVIGNGLPFALIAWGQQRIDAGLAGILMAVMPLMTLVLAHAFVPGERLSPRRGLGFVIGFGGIIVLLGPEAMAGAFDVASAFVAELAVLAGALCYAVSAILARRRPHGDAFETAAGTSIVAALITVPAALAFESPDWALVDGGTIAAVLFLGLVATALATVVYFRLVTLAGPSFLSLINYLIPVWAVIGGGILLHEQPQPRALAALALVLAGITLAESRRPAG